MEYLILLGVVAVLALATFIGYKKGMVKLLLSMVAMIIAYILAAALTVPVSAVIKSTTPAYGAIEDSVEELVQDANVKEYSLSKLNLPDTIKEKIMEGSGKITEAFNAYLVKVISNLILRALTFLILIIVIYIILRIVIHMLDFVAKLPLINKVNKVGGIVVGFAQGLLIVWVGCLLITAFGNKEWAQEMFKHINANSILTFIYEKNPLTFILTKFM